jgi:hypothetical protein
MAFRLINKHPLTGAMVMKTYSGIAALMVLTLTVVACSSGGGGSASMPAVTPLPAATDAFTQTVQTVAATASETAIPLPTDGFASVAADSAVPVSIN